MYLPQPFHSHTNEELAKADKIDCDCWAVGRGVAEDTYWLGGGIEETGLELVGGCDKALRLGEAKEVS